MGEFRAIDPQTHTLIDTAATMPDGTRMAGPADLHKALAARGQQLAQTITEKLMTYAVGRPMVYSRHAQRARHRARGRGRQLPI